ncbi:MAG: aconitate hydratase [Deltaproteobacteria bacterium]|nr:aconitate hydratase [Deltaproteobacteria bacterium]
MPQIETTPEMVENTYRKMTERLAIIRKRLGRPLTLMEKVLLTHLRDPEKQDLNPGKSYLLVQPDRVAMQDATAQMALLQFAQAGIPQVAVPSTVHCDHLIQAYVGADADLNTALDKNREVYDFLASMSNKYGIGFWKPGAGIIHQVVLENYAFPGGLMIGTDSHTPNAGGLGMFASGVGGADASDVMAGLPWEVLYPKKVGVVLKGKLNGWAAPKDVITQLCGILTVKGGTNRVVEYLGPGVRSISCTGKGTITNMGAELGATTSIFPYDERMGAYLKATRRAAIAAIADKYLDLLRADPEVETDPKKYFDEVVEIDLDRLEPVVVGPHTPDLARPVSQLPADVKKNSYPAELTSALIGSCTNSSYEDISRAADVARQAKAAGIKARIPLLVTPGSEQVFETIKRDGLMADLEAIGATVLANACGPCIGQWRRDDFQKGVKNSIINSFNRNFPARNDGNPDTLSFIGSPEVVVAYALAGRLDVNPLTDEVGKNGRPGVRLKAPAAAPEVPPKGFTSKDAGYIAPASDGSKVQVKVAPDSERLQLLEPFKPWDGRDFEKLPVLLKAAGKCTTDHISPAGVWLRYRGHLDKISDNMFLGAINAYTKEAGRAKNLLTGTSDTVPAVARHYKAQGHRWVVFGDENYGEGSSREHAAMSPRYLGAAAIIVRSFARIHETNLKKQGVLPLTFVNPADYEKVRETDRVTVSGLSSLAPGSKVKVTLHHEDGGTDSFDAAHSLNAEQIEWFKAGSALNLLARQAKRG